jgi:hypothetical protein
VHCLACAVLLIWEARLIVLVQASARQARSSNPCCAPVQVSGNRHRPREKAEEDKGADTRRSRGQGARTRTPSFLLPWRLATPAARSTMGSVAVVRLAHRSHLIPQRAQPPRRNGSAHRRIRPRLLPPAPPWP